jgi:hypothetical protein
VLILGNLLGCGSTPDKCELPSVGIVAMEFFSWHGLTAEKIEGAALDAEKYLSENQ